LPILTQKRRLSGKKWEFVIYHQFNEWKKFKKLIKLDHAMLFLMKEFGL
jgi:hypothetical protein